jgi:mono/diheme cytochrome c family protein
LISRKCTAALLLAASFAVSSSAAVTAAFVGPQKKQAPAKQAPAKKSPAGQKAAAPIIVDAATIALGKKTYDANGCNACHAIGGKGGAAGPDLTATGANPKHTIAWFELKVTKPAKLTPGSTMPAYEGKIKGKELTAIAAYMTTLKPAAGAANAGGPKIAKASPAVVAKLEKAGAAVREIAQNDTRLEVAYNMQGAAVNDAALVPVAGLANVVELHLGKTSVTDAGLVHLKGLTNLAVLHLEGTKVTDAGLVHLKNLPNLEYLNLYGTNVTDAGLSHLTGLKKLKKLYLWQTKVTPAGVETLKKALPQADINLGWEEPKKPA